MLGGERLSGTSRAMRRRCCSGADARRPQPRAARGKQSMSGARSNAPCRDGDASPPRREVVLVTGISGSGKSVALHALEDAGYFCVDNLPPELLREFIRLEHARGTHRVAVAVDVRSARARCRSWCR